ncbi:hypothetical protein Lal_00043646 [Lupinus albus]|nr:hypothetical protein Lal_00043646 [Lupinus albus]
MEFGKFVEGPEASTTMQDSFTHPRNHIPIPEVSVDISIEDDALLPIPADDITIVREVVGTFVTWLEHLIDVVPIIMFLLNIPGKGESPPQFYDSTINISIPEPIYGFYGQEFISINEVKDVHGRDWIGASVISVYIRYLYDNFVPNSKKKVMFISPHTNILGVGMVTNDTWKNQQSQDVAKILNGIMLTYSLHLLTPGNIGFWLSLIGALNIYRGLNTKRQRPLKCTHVKSHQTICNIAAASETENLKIIQSFTHSTSKIVHTFNIENHSRIEPQYHSTQNLSRIQHQNFFLSFNPESSLVLHRIERINGLDVVEQCFPKQKNITMKLTNKQKSGSVNVPLNWIARECPFSSKEVVNHFKVLGTRANSNKGTLSSVRVKEWGSSLEPTELFARCLLSNLTLQVVMDSEASFKVDRSRAVFRGDIEIRCSYSDRHRVILPRRSTVPAVYIMHLPDGYELRRTPPRAPARYITAPLGLSSGSYHARTRRVAPFWCTPRASTRRSTAGPPVTPASRTESTWGVQTCRCTRCLSVRESHMVSPAIVVRENLEFAPGSSSHGVRGRIQDDGVDIRGPVRRARLSPPPSYSPAPAEPMVRDDIIYISSDEEDPEEDPEEGSSEGQ